MKMKPLTTTVVRRKFAGKFRLAIIKDTHAGKDIYYVAFYQPTAKNPLHPRSLAAACFEPCEGLEDAESYFTALINPENQP